MKAARSITIFGVEVDEPRSIQFVQDPIPGQLDNINQQRVWRQLTTKAFGGVIRAILAETEWPLVGLKFSKGQASLLIQWFMGATDSQIKALEQRVMSGQEGLDL